MEQLHGFGVQPEGFEQMNLTEIDALNKALTVDHEYANTLPGSMTGGAVMQYESLDKTLRLVTYEMKNLKIWPDVPKDQAYNTVEEFDVQNSYGNNASPFFNMGDAPAERDAAYSRHVAKVKYVGTTRVVHHNLTLVRSAHGPVVAREVKNGTMFVLGAHERALFDGSEAENALEYDGFDRQIRQGDASADFRAQAFEGYGSLQSVVYDLRGDSLDEDHMESLALISLNNFSYPTDMYLDTKAHSDFSRSFFPKQRIAAPGSQVRGGIIVPDFQSSAGVIQLKSNVFRSARRAFLAVANNGSAPVAPTFSVAPAAAADAASKFVATDAGDYYYVASAFNEYGESAGTASASVTVAAGDKVTFTLANQAATYGFNIFRTNKDEAAAKAEFICRVIKGATTTVVTDYNEMLPGLSKGYLMKVDADNMLVRQLAPLMKMDLAIVSTAYRFMVLSYLVPMLFTPRMNVIAQNIGRAS